VKPQNPLTTSIDPQTLDLRDIHLPDPISWWPLAPGWWLTLCLVCLLILIFYISRKIYSSRRLKRDISSELDKIKQQYAKNKNKLQLVQGLSILLRRASISFYPAKVIAGVTGEDWLQLLDDAITQKDSDLKFHSDLGRVLITVPYQSEDSLAEFDADALIKLCASWLSSSHKKALTQQATNAEVSAS